MNVQIDMIGKGKSQGEVSQMLASSRLDPGAMRPFIGEDGKPYISVFSGGDPTKPESYRTELVNNASLRRDEWIALDEAVAKVAETRLRGIADLAQRGLVYNLGNAMGTTVLESHEVSDALAAELSMDGITRGQNDAVAYSTTYLPIPIIHVDYEINARVLAASRSLGNGIDTTLAERSARKVAEHLEKMLFTNETYSFGGGNIYSYINYPSRNKVTIGANWDCSTVDGEQIVKDVLEMKQASIDNYHYGPWVLYIPTGYETLMDEDYDSTTPGTTTRERILKISGVEDVKVIDTLTANNVLLVQMTSDVVRLVRGMGIQNVEWAQEGNMITKYKVMTIQVPQIRSDYNGKCGVIHAATSH